MNASVLPASPTGIRDATEADFAAIAAIYAHHVLNGFASFEIEAPDAAILAARWQAVLKQGLPYLVVEEDGVVRGFSYAMPYRPRRAYRYTVENSIYVSATHTRQGLGGRLIEALVERCAALGYRQMIAVIGATGNSVSIGFHERHGFRHAGRLPSVGFKHGRWIDSALMVRPLGDGDRSAPDTAL